MTKINWNSEIEFFDPDTGESLSNIVTIVEGNTGNENSRIVKDCNGYFYVAYDNGDIHSIHVKDVFRFSRVRNKKPPEIWRPLFTIVEDDFYTGCSYNSLQEAISETSDCSDTLLGYVEINSLRIVRLEEIE